LIGEPADTPRLAAVAFIFITVLLLTLNEGGGK